MKTLLLMVAFYGNSNSLPRGYGENQIPTSTNFIGLHYVISVDADVLTAHKEILVRINDTLNENSYSIYKTKDYILACRNRNKMEEKGIAAEVKAYFNDEEISMDDAYAFMNNKNTQEAIAYNDENKKRLKEIIGWNDKVKMFYSITVSMQNDSVYLNQLTTEFVSAIKQINGNEQLAIGKFLTFNEVKTLYDEMVEQGVSNISITASEFGKEIPVSNAVGKEQEYLQQLLAINK